mgnify:FL=1|tara:strand:- start:2204 stop:4075 length:1872 start_codon:yes stop_codon:yes gene_type:complete
MADDNTGQFQELIDLMAANNKSTIEIERDGRNTRRHLLEMKKLQTSALETNKSISTVFENFFEAMDANKLSDAEGEMERLSLFEDIRASLDGGIVINDNGKSDSKSGPGMLGKLGGMMGGAAMAAGALLAGVGIGAAGLTYAMGKMEELDTKKIKENVDDLLSMAESDRMTVGNVAGVSATMFALGVGLAAFTIGEGASKAVAKFSEGSDWPQDIKDNVETLLSIGDIPGMGGDAAAVSATLLGLGVGLAAFGIGKAADGVGTAIQSFTEGNFADSIKKEVGTLLSIDTGKDGQVGDFVGTMSGLGLGLAAFGIGKAVGGMGDAITKFSGGDNFAQGIKDEVETLLSIDTTSGIDAKTFKKTLSGLGAGLAAFGIGSFFASGDGVADSVKKEVDTLLTIGDGADMDRTLAATGSLVALGVGLAAFGAGTGVKALADLGAGIVGFFTGSKSPVEQAIEVGEKADTITAGADAFSAFADVFERMSTMGDISIDMDDSIEEMVEYTKLLETVLQGGKLTKGKNFETDGLANLTGDVDKAVSNINRVRDVLQLQSGSGSQMQTEESQSGNKIITLSAENIELRMPQAAAQGNTVAVADNSKKSTVQNTIVNTQPKNRVSDTLQNAYG